MRKPEVEHVPGIIEQPNESPDEYSMGFMAGVDFGKEDLMQNVMLVINRAQTLVEMLDDAEVNHGGLWAGRTMRARDELRRELSKWQK